MKFSIVIPARNEERTLGRCLDSIEAASQPFGGDVETIVVLNRCTDATERIATERGCRIVREDRRCLSAIRNAGARAAVGEILVTIDADSRMSPDTLREVDAALASRRHVGGGVRIRTERMSAGIWMTGLVLRAMLWWTGLEGGLYWCRRKDFEAIGGFDERLLMAEDLDFARRLRAFGASCGLRFGVLPHAYIVTSCRKFDHFGDWFFFRALFFRGRQIRGELKGEGRRFADLFFYEFRR